jgi:hypothetical protein
LGARALKKQINRPEQDLQIGVISYLRPALIAPARVWFVPNGIGGFSIRAAGIYKSMGLMSGVHDLHFIWPGGNFGTIEMKADDGGFREGQIAFGNDMAACGHPWDEARSLDEVLAVLTRWGVPLRTPNEAVINAFKTGQKISMYPSKGRF